MAIKLPPTDTSNAASPSLSRDAAPTPARPQHQYASDDGPPDEGVRREATDRTTANAGAYPRADSFDPLPVGEHVFIFSVHKVIPWHFGTRVTLRVEYDKHGEHRGRQIDWEQVEPERLPSEASRAVWRSRLFGAYAAGGWGVDPDPSTGWPGWRKTASGALTPPYYLIGVHEAPDESHVPVLLEGRVSVRAGYEKFVNVTSIKQYLDAAGKPVQAPLPYGVPLWMARMHRWAGTEDSVVVKSGENAGKSIPFYKLQFDQFKVGHCGMTTWRDL